MKDKFIQFRASEIERRKLDEIAERMGTDMSGAIRKLITIASENAMVNEIGAAFVPGMLGTSEEDYRKIIADDNIFAPMWSRFIVVDAFTAILKALEVEPPLHRMVMARLMGESMDKVVADALKRETDLRRANAELREMVRREEQGLGVAE